MKINNKSHHPIGLIHDWVDEDVKNIVDECYIMPDTHKGATVPIGFVCQITDKLIPEMCGVDISCGMSYFKMPKRDIDFAELQAYIEKRIPSGFNSHKTAVARYGYGQYDVQIGTLGGGNHFIEIDEGIDAYYVIVHSGSRRMGADVCKKHTDIMLGLNKEENKKTFLKKVEDVKKELIKAGKRNEIQNAIKNIKDEPIKKPYLTGEDLENYMIDMREAHLFAEHNREMMLMELKRYFRVRSLKAPIIHVTHNYIDHHNVLRKGACSAHKGQDVLIPINMRDGCIVGIGKGNKDWLYSAPHGAGRILSRSQAKALLSLEDFQDDMEGINTFCVDKNRIDEAPRSYNNIETILNNIEETIEVVEIIKPIFNFKG